MEAVVTQGQRRGISEGADDATNRFVVALIDDHSVFTGALATVLAGQPDVAAVLTAASLDEGRRLMARERPELAVIDVRLERDDGLVLLKELPIVSPRTRAVVLTAHPQPAIVKRASALGACAVLPKGIGLPELITTLRQVLRGERPRSRPDADEPAHPLTWRETEVLQLLADGRDPHQIARLLDLSTHTVRDHIRNVRAKLGVQTVLAAVVEGARLGAIEVPVR